MYLERNWLNDTISYSFGGTPFWLTQGFVSSYNNPNSTLIAQFNAAVYYIESKIDVHLSLSESSDIKVFNGNPICGCNGYCLHDSGGTATKADIFIHASESSNDGLVLHELGHALGLGHTTAYNNLSLTVMNPNYTSAQLAGISVFGQYDLALLNGAFGSAAAYTGNWSGTPWNDTLYGGTGINDAADGPEITWGNGGSDTLYGNGGNDTIYGGAGIVDQADFADIIYGGAGNDTIYGNAGNDTIYSGQGADTIYGGLGADIVYLNRSSVFVDYQQGVDSIFWV